MLTILIFSSNRLELLKELLNDITSSKRFKFINLQIVFYDTKFIPNDKFLRKLSSLQNVKLSNEKLNLSGVEKFIKYSKKINTRFLWVLSDDAYYEIRYSDDDPKSIVNFPGMKERTVVLYTFSKKFAI